MFSVLLKHHAIYNMAFSIVASSSDNIHIPHTSRTVRISMVITSKKQANKTTLAFNMTIQNFNTINGRLNPGEVCFKRSKAINPNMELGDFSDMVMDAIRLTNSFSIKV